MNSPNESLALRLRKQAECYDEEQIDHRRLLRNLAEVAPSIHYVNIALSIAKSAGDKYALETVRAWKESLS
jgi:hypothetical protein